MTKKLVGMLFFAVGLAGIAGSASAFPPINPAGVSVDTAVVDVSFFGRPYPYGYTDWGPCVRWVQVQSPTGQILLKKVRSCEPVVEPPPPRY